MILGDLQEAISNFIIRDDQCAFEKIYKSYYNRLFRLAVSIVKSEDVAHEIYDDVMLNLWEKRKQLIAVNNFTVYLYVAVKNAALRELNKAAKMHCVEIGDDFDVEDTAPTAHDTMMSLELLGIINHAISELSPQCRRILKMVKDDGLKYKEVAEILDISIKNVEYHMGNALKRISHNVATAKMPAKNQTYRAIVFN